MKNVYLILTVVLIFGLLLIPLAAVEGTKPTQTGQSSNASTQPANAAPANAAAAGCTEFKVLDAQTQKSQTLTRKEYLLGVLAAEMPATYETEALKAQAVAAYTFALFRKAQNSSESYDITTDYTVDQAFANAEQRQKNWGEKAAECEKKLLSCIEAVDGTALFYENAPILAAYHAISGGNTESAEVVWGKAYPYLVPCVSTGDLLSPDYLSEVKLSTDDFKAKLQALGCKPEEDAAAYIGAAKKSNSGTVIQWTLCGKALTGAQLRTAFNLRSANFDLTFKDGQFYFAVKGYGHGVGMSQYGANYLAQQGSGFAEILKHYSPGCSLQQTK